MPILENVLSNEDQKVRESACLTVCRIVNSFSRHPKELEQLVSPTLMKKLLELLNPNFSIASSHSLKLSLTQVTAQLARSINSLAVLLIPERVCDLIYQLLTDHAPVFDDSDVVQKDSTAIVQALIHCQRDLMLNCLSIITDLFVRPLADKDSKFVGPYSAIRTEEEQKEASERMAEFAKYPDDLRHFCKVTCSLLLDIYSSSIDVRVRQGVLSSFLHILNCLDSQIISEVLRDFELASLISSIISQHENPSLLVGAIEIAELLLRRIPSIYKPAFYRLGIISQVQSALKVAQEEAQNEGEEDAMEESEYDEDEDEEDDDDIEDDEDDEQDEDDEDEDENEEENIDKVPRKSMKLFTFHSDLKPLIIHDSARLIEAYEKGGTNRNEFEQDIALVQAEISKLVADITSRTNPELRKSLRALATIIGSISSFELVHCGVFTALLDVLVNGSKKQIALCRREFVNVFMTAKSLPDSSRHGGQPSVPLEMLVSKLHEVLGRSEQLQIVTSSTWDSRSNATGMLARQLRLKLVADEDSGIPASLRSVNLSIQAIATFKAIDEFFRSKIALNSLFTRATTTMKNADGTNAVHRNLSSTLEAPESVAGLRDRPGPQEDVMAALADDHDDEGDNLQEEGEEDGGNNGVDPDLSPGSTTILRRPTYTGDTRGANDEWHLEFEIDGEPIVHDGTVIGAIYRHLERKAKEQDIDRSSLLWSASDSNSFARGIWNNTYKIRVKKVDGPLETPAGSEMDVEAEAVNPFETTPASFGEDPTISVVIRLLSILFTLNASVNDLLDTAGYAPLYKLPDAKFLSSKLTAKLNKQLEEPLVVTSGILPPWIVDATRLYPFLFPFETRYVFLQSTSFGYSRSMNRWQMSSRNGERDETNSSSNRPPMGRLIRQKVRVSRSHLLHSAIKVMDLCGASPNVLEVEFFNEVGTGLGPTLEFYSSVSKEFTSKKYKMWRDGESDPKSKYSHGHQGLFPAPMDSTKLSSDNGKKILQLFKTLGTFIARAMLDSRIIDVNLNPVFFRIAGSNISMSPSIGTLASIDRQLASSLMTLQKFSIKRKKALASGGDPLQVRIDGVTLEDLALDFTLPGYPEIEMIPGGRDMYVSIDNVDSYIRLVIDFTIGRGVATQIEAFRKGFSLVFPYSALHAFTPEELTVLCGQGEEDWSVSTLYEAIKADHGYTKDSRVVKDLLQSLSEFTFDQRRAFLQFMTGSPNLPIGGFKTLNPPFTIVCKHHDKNFGRDDYLPSVMTCANYLKLPNYSSREVLEKRLLTAIYEGSGAFLLS